MEYKKKKLTNEQIKEIELKKIDDIKNITDEYVEKFEELGYSLVTKLMVLQSTDSDYHELKLEDDRDYSPEYVSQFRITVEKPYTEDDYEKLEEIKEENASFIQESDEDKEFANEQFGNANAECNTKAKAFLDYLLIRTYKSFFIEYVATSDDEYTQLKSDLEEFYTHFSNEVNGANE